MRTLHITFSDKNMTKSAILSRDSALKYGANHSIMFNEKCYEPFFYKLNQNIIKQERGAGYWLWKPYIILNNLNRLSDGDILIYTDAGVEIINDLKHIIDRMDSDIFLFGNNYKHLDWCKMHVMESIMPDWPFTFNEDYRQVQASAIIIRNSESAKDFVGKWLKLCQVDGFIDDSPSLSLNYHTFQEHRHDQAILTALQIKYGYKLHYWAAQYNSGAFVYDKLPQYESDTYPIMFHHTRKRNNEWQQ